VSPYVSTPRFARVFHYPLRGDTPRRPVWFLAKQEFTAPPNVMGGGVTQDRLKKKPKAARCAMVERIAKTSHNVLRLLAYFEGSLREGGTPPTKTMKKKLALKVAEL